MKKLKYFLAIVIVGFCGYMAAAWYVGSNFLFFGASILSEVFSLTNPAPTLTVELREPAQKGDYQPHKLASGPGTQMNKGDWISYNRTVYGDRFSPLKQINEETATNLEVKCEYDSGIVGVFETSLVKIENQLIFTTTEDVVSLDPVTCKEHWRVHKDSGLGKIPANRGVGYVDGMVGRGYADGFFRAFDAKTGKQLWETYLGDPERALFFTSSAIGWNGMFFYGIAGGDTYDVRGRVFALDAKTGEIKWQTFTVPKLEDDAVYAKLGKMPEQRMLDSWKNPPDVPITGGGTWTSYSIDPVKGIFYIPVGNPAPDFVASLRPGSNLFTNTVLALDINTGDYIKDYSIMKDDWHDWDVSNPPIFYTSRAGKDLMSFHPKDGHLYSFDLNTDKQLYRMPVTRIENATATFEPKVPVHFCPGSNGGGEWNSAAYDPQYNLLFTGQNDWCTTATIMELDDAAKEPLGGIWFGENYTSPYNAIGKMDPVSTWGGWVYASDADTGEWKWRAKSNYPTLSGITPMAGDIVAFGDMGGMFYVMRASDGKEVFSKKFPGALAGGVISYSVDDTQYVAFTSGLSHPLWPVAPTSGKIVVMGLAE